MHRVQVRGALRGPHLDVVLVDEVIQVAVLVLLVAREDGVRVARRRAANVRAEHGLASWGMGQTMRRARARSTARQLSKSTQPLIFGGNLRS